ncbi:MAG TPA: DUF4129 domain-containing protein [Terracidiphilus sp.]|nr:DUF4129 domain-containing protein [Terracidiphilus sp.]
MRSRAIFLPVALVASLAVAQQAPRSPIPTAPSPASGGWQDVSISDYRKHLEALSAVVEACAKARDAKACDPTLVGKNDRVALGNAPNAERRPVRYAWLRVLLLQAQKKDAPKSRKPPAGVTSPLTASVALPPPPSTSELLQTAEKRLAADDAQAGGARLMEPENAAQHAAMEQVLAGREFRGLRRRSAGETLAEKIDNWLNSFFAGAMGLGARAPWLGRAVEAAFILVVCVGLVWGLLQMERRWRIRLTPESIGPAPQAPSARDWQLWIEDARRAAAGGLWRDAIHCVYWAAISHLETRRLWPADRARTPREYLALMAGEDPRRAGLAALTGSFERTWYGGRPAGEGEYTRAEELAKGLIGSTTPVLSARGAGR